MSFTWFDNYSEIFRELSPEQRSDLIMAIIDYAETGEEAELEFPVSIAFAGIKPNIMSSVRAHESGSKGGRPKKAKQPLETEARENEETGVEKGPLKPNGMEWNGEERSGSGNNAPAREECEEFFGGNGSTRAAGARFHAHYASQGWMKGNGQPVTDWRVLASHWIDQDAHPAEDREKRMELDWPPSLPCPECGVESRHTGGGVYLCPECNGFGMAWRAEVPT